MMSLCAHLPLVIFQGTRRAAAACLEDLQATTVTHRSRHHLKRLLQLLVHKPSPEQNQQSQLRTPWRRNLALFSRNVQRALCWHR